MLVAPKVIQELRRQCLHHNIFPIFLPNAFFDQEPEPVYRILAAAVPTGVQFLRDHSDQEINAVIDHLPPGLKMMVEERPIDLRDAPYLERVVLYTIASQLEEGYNDFRSAIQTRPTDGEVLKIYPELKGRFDDDDLLILDDEFTLMDGGILYKDHVLHYSQFLRRGFGSNPNFDFLSRFANYFRKTRGNNKIRIAIDHRRIMGRDFYKRIVEMDGWFGPMFDTSALDDLQKAGLTLIERERPSLFDMTSKIQRTEIYWSADRNTKIKTCEIEEVCDEDQMRDTYHINRYTHTERDTMQKQIRHFDGAVKIYYDAHKYAQRFAASLPKEPRADAKVKLFRIDGDIAVDTWCDLTTMFFKGNEMVVRYFDNDQYEARLREKIDHYKQVMNRRSEGGEK